MRLGGIAERFDERVIPQRLVDPRPLHPNASSVDQPDLPQAGPVRRADVLVNHGRDVPRRERVQVDRVFDWNAMHVSQISVLPRFFMRHEKMRELRSTLTAAPR
jgi:hypothetical protein